MTISMTDQPSSSKTEDSEVVLSVEGVSKKFCRDLKRSLFYGVQDIASDLLGIREKSDKLRKKEFWAVDNVSFELRRGEALGLVGKNGSGKSTLLRIIAGLIKPDLGTVKVKGRVAPLIALGAGFNPILTGRENIYANMSILGLTKQEIDDRFDEVVEFAEIGDAIDSPVQTYSSGMAARLGFATAIHTEPDILLIDEVLAVGDIKFRAKCHRKLNKLREKGISFILVSHNAQAILNICYSGIYLSQGQLILSGSVDKVVEQYEQDLFLQNINNHDWGIKSYPAKTVSESLGIDIVSVFFRNKSRNIIKSPISSESTYFCIGCKIHQKICNVTLKVEIREIAGEGDFILVLNSFYDKKYFTLTPENQEIQLYMPYLCLKPGAYTTKISVCIGGLHTLDVINCFRFVVKSKGIMTQCLFYQPREWTVDNYSRPSEFLA